MADLTNSLLSLEEELSCSICLSVFENPVTTPCGHNFCQDCLDKTWQECSQVALGFNCPQCRTHFYTKPELNKNTVLSNVVRTFKFKAENSGAVSGDVNVNVEVKKEEAGVADVMCDVCQEIKAHNTCLTCMASFCLEHMRPHRENPIFSTHQVTQPLSDLKERICPSHNKLMEFYCNTHNLCICMVCLPEKHNSCNICKPEDRRSCRESELKKSLYNLDGKIEKTNMVISQMKEQQYVLKDSASCRKRALEVEFRQIRELIDRSEQEAMNLVDREQKSGDAKIESLMKRFQQNVGEMKGVKTRIESLLSKPESFMFLQAKVNMPSAVDFSPYAPRVSIDSKQVLGYQDSVVALKNLIENLLKQPVENRLPLLKPDTQKDPGEAFNTNTIHDCCPPKLQTPRNVPDPGTKKQPKSKPKEKDEKADQTQRKKSHPTKEAAALKIFNEQPKGPRQDGPCVPRRAPNIVSASKRSDLLKYATELTLDIATAHKRIILLESHTKAAVTDEPCPYPEGPARFSVCSQVLCTSGFSQGCHYWEVKMSNSNFCGIGLAYGSIDRKGPTSRLGRNSQSWCIEWFNVKLSAWHDSSETVLENPNPSRVGILLDCDQGTITFYSVADRAYPFHSFICRFTEPVYPAFWIFSSGSHVTLCKLIN